MASVVMDVITSALFPKKGPSPEDIWNSIKGYAETFMKNAMDQQKLEDMKTELVGKLECFMLSLLIKHLWIPFAMLLCISCVCTNGLGMASTNGPV